MTTFERILIAILAFYFGYQLMTFFRNIGTIAKSIKVIAVLKYDEKKGDK